MMTNFYKHILGTMAALLLSAFALPLWAANTKTTVEQVSTTVTLDSDVDYIITSATPFTEQGVVNITNTDHAVIILEKVKPSKAISSWLRYIQVDGVKATNKSNCMVKLYNQGCIILPYAGGDKFKPLTVYDGKNFEGESCNDFGLEHTGGYMNTLTDEKLNNRISSFKLKRGYMVTFSLKAGGRGYSRCFIAADSDLEMATMPGILDNSISSYRVFKWYDAGKKNIASCTDKTILSALNVQSCYDWGQGNNSLEPDYEWVPNHIYEDWPSTSTIGSTTQSPHTKANNEPRNTSDDHPQDLATILGNWENMMRTGLRLCSPASWDGSDYWNATGFLAEFLDSIDARGWRCDIIDLHCYWAEGSFGNMHYWSDKYKRPIWISEWCWGASWNNNGAFAPGVTQQQVKEALQRICTNLNNWDYVERYFYWNSEAAISKVYNNGLTPAGQYYSAMDAGIGYKGKMNYVPKVPTQYNPSDLQVSFDKKKGIAVITWHDYNGEMNASMVLEKNNGAGTALSNYAVIEQQESAADYIFVDSAATNGCQYRVSIVDGNNKTRTTSTMTAVGTDVIPGDEVQVGDQTKYLGGNLISNGAFDMDFHGWLNGKDEPLSAPYFQVVPVGGVDGGAYLQAYGNGTQATESALKTSFPIETNTDYYASVSNCALPTGYTVQFGVSKEGSSLTVSKLLLNNTSAKWDTRFGTFNSGDYTLARCHFYSLASKAQIDQIILCRLFATKDSAIADGVEKARAKAEMFKEYNTLYPELNTNLSEVLTSVTTTDQQALTTLSSAVENAIQIYHVKKNGNQLLNSAKKWAAAGIYGADKLQAAIQVVEQATALSDMSEGYSALEKCYEEYVIKKSSSVSSVFTNPSFTSATGWETKTGTYKGGDQRLATHDGVTCWNAWWSGIDSNDETNTMAINQKSQVKQSGLYALECRATTEHYCLSDQHAYFTVGEVTEESPVLAADFLDLPTVDLEDRWQLLSTAPLYMEYDGQFAAGFTGSKKGSQANWLERGNTKSTNDKREGWWCATDFALRFIPMYKLTVTPEQWGIICRPFVLLPYEDVTYYKVAGVTADYQQLCLEEEPNPIAGMAYIYRSNKADAVFFESGNYDEAVTATIEAPGNIRGYLRSAARVPQGYFYVKDGAFVKQEDSSNRPSIGNYTGIMRAFTDRANVGVPVKDNWTGLTMPLVGVTQEEIAHNNELWATGIGLLQHQQPSVIDGIYTIDGRNVTHQSLKSGLYIKVVDGKSYKIFIK